MSAFNVVRFRVRPGQEQRFIDAHSEFRPKFKGFVNGYLIRTGSQAFCMVGEWRDMESLAAARDEMIAFLDTFRELLEDLGGDLGVTDPVSGEVVVKVAGAKKKKKGKAGSGAKGKSKGKAKSRDSGKKQPRKKKKKK